jgi:threonine aldolase
MKKIDLRSDTVTQPTAAMRAAMAEAPVGDDVYGEDPTLNLLQERAARLLGKEAALFVASGTMGNQVALAAQTRPGDVVITGGGSHIILWEAGAPSALWGVQVEPLPGDGLFDGAALRRAIPPDDVHNAPARLVCVENTHNRAGGRVFPLDQVKDVAAVARDAGLALHLDGARIFNASVATGTSVADLAAPFDTVTFCLSKGLGAPVGSVVCGELRHVRRMHRARKMLGGGMRQAGMLAAAGLHALEHHVERLADDHDNARRLASGLEARGFRVDPPPETNLVMFDVIDAAAFERAALQRGLLVSSLEEGRIRAVTHLDVSRDDIDDALARIDEMTRTGIR